MKQRAPPWGGVALFVAGSLLILLVIAVIGNVTGQSLIQLIIGFPIIVVGLKLALKSQTVENMVHKKLQNLIEKKLKILLKEKAKSTKTLTN